MKVLILLFIISSISIKNDNDKLVGLWKSLQENNVDYLNLRPNGDYIKINNKETKKLKYTLKEKFIQIEETGGNFKEEPTTSMATHLYFNPLKMEKLLKKYLRQKLAL